MNTEFKESIKYGLIVLGILIIALLVLWYTQPNGTLLPDVYSVM
jgi:predicted RND superfamily exporter protein